MTTFRAENDVEDAINRYIRHCRIGKVTVKKPAALSVIPLDGWKWTPQTREWWQLPHYPNFATPNTAG